MILKITNNKKEIEDFILNDEIFNRAKGVLDIDKKDVEMPIGSMIYIGGYDKGKLFGLCCYHKYKDGLKLHPYLLREHRRKAREFFKKSLDMINCNIYVQFNDSDKLLINLARNFGFDSIANNKDSSKVEMRLNKHECTRRR